MESLRGRKLRPLFRKLPGSQTSLGSSRAAAAFSSSCCLAHNNQRRTQRMEAAILPLPSHCYWTAAARKGMELDQQVRREGSTRWNPTKEQLRELEELYARGTRTPPAHQIQLIAAELRRYGRIEGKNVFYWFQNHKARERQRRLRRQAEEEDAAAAAAAGAAAASDDRNRLRDSGGAAPAAAAAGSGVVLKQESKSLATGKSDSGTPPATSAAAGGRGEETAQSPWLRSHQQSLAEGGAEWQDTTTSRHRQSSNSHLSLPAAAAAAADDSISGPASTSAGESNVELSWACTEALAGELAAGEEKPAAATLELFPLRSENLHHLLGSSPGSCRKPAGISSHVQFFQFL